MQPLKEPIRMNQTPAPNPLAGLLKGLLQNRAVDGRKEVSQHDTLLSRTAQVLAELAATGASTENISPALIAIFDGFALLQKAIEPDKK